MKAKLERKYDFHEGVEVSENNINKWHKQVLDKLQEDPECKSFTIRSGNSFVTGKRSENDEIDIFEITKGYKHFNYKLEEDENN